MTKIAYVTGRQMEEQTGFKTALGYAKPKDDTILIRKGLTKSAEKKVRAHEEDHIKKGEEGPFLGALLGIGATLLGANMSSRSADRATDASVAGNEREIEFYRESRDLARSDAAPYREAGYTALDALMSLTGLASPKPANAAPRTGRAGPRRFQDTDYLGGLRGGRRYRALRYAGGSYNINELGPESRYEGGSYTRNDRPTTIEPAGVGYIHPRVEGGPVGYVPPNIMNKIRPTFTPRSTIDNDSGEVISMPAENPGGVEGGFNFMTDPGYEFRVGEGMRALDRGAAARGGLLSGGYARRAIRYGQDYASNEYTNVYNRIANIAGLGQVSAGQSGQAALYAGAGMGGAASDIGAARASGYTAQGNAYSNAINEISKIDWGSIFKKDPGALGPPV